MVPFGGGTSVVGGVDAAARRARARGRARPAPAAPSRSTDARSPPRSGPGLRGPEAEAALGERGLTLGHFPQSFEYATIGGFAATRSAGQASSGYGRFDELVTSVAMRRPPGELRTLQTPHTAAGPALRELVVGSEGTLGVITEVTVRVRPAPAQRRYEAWWSPTSPPGARSSARSPRRGALPDVMRLSDEAETAVSMGLAGVTGARSAAPWTPT